jgi:hypothetical protein
MKMLYTYTHLRTEKAFFAPIVVDAVMSLDEDLSLDMIGVKKVPGGSLEVRIPLYL